MQSPLRASSISIMLSRVRGEVDSMRMRGTAKWKTTHGSRKKQRERDSQHYG